MYFFLGELLSMYSLTVNQWDIRTFHLLHTVSALDQCQIRFSNAGDIIYGMVLIFTPGSFPEKSKTTKIGF